MRRDVRPLPVLSFPFPQIYTIRRSRACRQPLCPNVGPGQRRLTGRRLALSSPHPRGGNTVLLKGVDWRMACVGYSIQQPLPVLYTSMWGQFPPCIPITSPSCSHSPMAPERGKFPFLIISWLHLVRHYWLFPYTCHWGHATLLDLGRSEVVQRMISLVFRHMQTGPPDSCNQAQPVLSSRS